MGILRISNRRFSGVSRTALVLAATLVLVAGCIRHPEAIYRAPMVIDGRTIPDAALFRQDFWFEVVAEPVLGALNGTFEKADEGHVLVVTLNGKRVVITPGRTDVRGDLEINEPVSMTKEVLIHAQAFKKAVEFAFPGARISVKKGKVIVETQRH